MEAWLSPLMEQLLAWLALPQHGLSTVFTIAFISATLLPMGSEPAVFGLVKLNPDLFWAAILVATAGNTLGGMLSWLPGVGDPLCAVAGWLKMPLLACTIYMAIGKFLRYLLMTSLLMWVF